MYSNKSVLVVMIKGSHLTYFLALMPIFSEGRGERDRGGSFLMGNYRFRLSDMMPNAWFYKLKDMSRARNHNTAQSIKKKLPSPAATSQKTNLSQPRYSYYYNEEPIRADMLYGSPVNPKASDTHFPDPPRKSSKRRPKRKTIYKPSPTLVSSVSAGYGCPAAFESVWTEHDPTESEDCFVSAIEPGHNVSLLPEVGPNTDVASDTFNGLAPLSTSCSCRVCSSTTDIFIDVSKKSFSSKVEKLDEHRRSSSQLEEIKAQRSLSIKIVKEGSKQTQKEPKANPLVRKPTANAAGVKLRTNSPRLASRKIQAYARKSFCANLNSFQSRSCEFTKVGIVKECKYA
ncbi:unnamed protein product, partial [Vitis vinifera]|uniref:Ovate family protein-like n=1 Tax=Vitis vinifera TaxID=29760 RepID=A0A3Q8WHX6_VITVI